MAGSFDRLGWEVVDIDRVYRYLSPAQLNMQVYPEWDVLDVLRHVVWWHESFADILEAAAEHTSEEVPRGSLAEVNSRSVLSLRAVDVRRLRRRLTQAHERLAAHAEVPAQTSLGYRRGSRRYTFAERIDIAVGELHAHRHDVLRAVLEKV